MANTRHQEVDEASERDLEIMWMGVAVARLEVGEAVERTPECSSHVDALAIVDIEAGERSSDHIDDAFDCRLQFVVAGAWVAVGGGIQPRGITDDGAPRIAECANRIFTSNALSRLTEAFGEEFPTPQTEAANQVVVAVDMAIAVSYTHLTLPTNREV